MLAESAAYQAGQDSRVECVMKKKISRLGSLRKFDWAYKRAIKAARRARRRSDWMGAAELYKKALILNPQALDAAVQMGHAMKESGDFDGAEAAYKSFLAVHPEDADIHLQFGHLFNLQGDLDEASAWYEKALLLAPTNSDISFHAAQVRRRIERDQPEDRRDQMMLALKQGDIERAYRAARPLFAENYLEVVASLGWVFKDSGLFEQLEAVCRRNLERANPGDADLAVDAELQFGYLCKLRGDLSRALTHFIRAKAHKLEKSGHLLRDDPIFLEIRDCKSALYPSLR